MIGGGEDSIPLTEHEGLSQRDASYASSRLLRATIIARKSGGGGATTGEPPQPHDIIQYYPKTKERIFSECTTLYKKGLSLREIETRTGIPKSTIRHTLIKKGFVLRNFSSSRKQAQRRSTGKRPGGRPYGYGWLDGKLIPDPKEFNVVRLILKLWQSGKSYKGIVEHLNRHSIKTRAGGKWMSGRIRAIVQRQLANSTEAKQIT